MADLQAIADNLFKGKAKEVKELVETALREGVPVCQILNEGLIAGMVHLGTKFKNNEIYVPEVLIAARAMKFGMEVLKPLFTQTGVKPIGTVVIGTVKGDLHDIGKNLVGMMLEGTGFRVIDLGIDVSSERFIAAVNDYQPQILAMSALLTTTKISMQSTIVAINEAGLKDKVKILVGGAPVTQRYSIQIGADGYAPDAGSAIDKAKQLIGIL
jgi:5-methyltetrahydrofolate--homocysteine methyltransferase